LSKPRMAVACMAMRVERLFLFSIFVLFSSTQAKTLPPSDCSPCSLPFLYQGRLHFQCTTVSPVKGDLFGRCPTQSDLETGEASEDPAHWIRCDNTCPLQSYTPNDVIISKFEHLAKKFPQTAKIVEVGKSTLGQRIVGLRISDNVHQERELLKPMVRFSGNMHGNEPVGREMLIHLAHYLLQARPLVSRVAKLLASTDITLIPTINPDGFDRGTEGACSGGDYETGRYNEGSQDLNRDFPTWRQENLTREALFRGRQPETKAMMKLILEQPWVLSANFHDGAVVASYPYDDYRDGGQQSGIHKTPDHEFFHHLATTYATNHGTMMDPQVCTRWWFEKGITNGADWYPLNGGMQDFNYIFTNDMEITLELSCCKFPKRYYLNKEWERNQESLLSYLEQVHRGVRGLVKDSAGDPVREAIIFVTEEGLGALRKNVTTSFRGEFWRLLMPGEYTVTAELSACDTAGIVMSSLPVKVSLTEDQRLVDHQLVLDQITPCSEGPR